MDGISVVGPDGWQDRSMIVFSDPAMPKSGVAPNVVVTQDDLSSAKGASAEERIRNFADKMLGEMKQQLPSPIVHLQQLTEVDGKAAAEILVSWQQARVRLTQWVVFVHRDEQRVVIATSTAAESEFADNRDQFSRIVYSMKL